MGTGMVTLWIHCTWGHQALGTSWCNALGNTVHLWNIRDKKQETESNQLGKLDYGLRVTELFIILLLLLFSCSVMSDSLRPHGLQHARLPCPSTSPGACSSSCPLSWWCHPTILSSVVPVSSCPQSFSASGSFPMSQFFPSGGQSIGVSASASVLPMNIPDWFPLGRTGWFSLQSKGLSRVFSNTTVQKHQFFGTQLSL